MESSTAASAGAQAPELRIPASARRARSRGLVLGHRLWISDLVSSVLAALVPALIFEPGAGVPSIVGFAALTAALWSFFSFTLGLYRGEQLSAWASSLTEVPPFCVGLVLLSWPLFGAARLLDFDHRAILTLIHVVLLAGFDTVARTVVRARIHQVEDLRQRTLMSAPAWSPSSWSGSSRNNAQYGLTPVGMVDDEVHDRSATATCPCSAASTTSRVLETQSDRPRDHRLLPGQPRSSC